MILVIQYAINIMFIIDMINAALPCGGLLLSLFSCIHLVNMVKLLRVLCNLEMLTVILFVKDAEELNQALN